MAKKKKNSSSSKKQQQQQQQQQLSEAWEVDSVLSCSTELSDKAGAAEEQNDDVLYDLIEALFEKRSSTRITALQQIVLFLSQSVAVEECEEKLDNLLNRVLNCISKGGSDEVLVAAKVAGFLCVTMGMEDGNERLIEQMILPFKKILKQSSKSVSCKAVVLETVALMCFVSVEDADVLTECLSILESQFSSQEPLIKVSALRGWSLIVSNLSVGDMDLRKIEDGLFGEIAHMLQMSNVDVRGAAGEALAVINHRFGGVNLEDYMEDEEEEGWDSESVAYESMSSTVTDAMEGVKDRMRDLVKNRGDQQRKSRKDRASQRSQFRELLQMVEHGEVKREELKLRYGDRMVVEGLEGKIQLNAIRKYLGGGFQQHLQHNELLHNIFDYKPTTTKVDKNFSSAYSKAKTQKRNMDRKNASAKKGSIYEQDDY